MEHAVNNLIEEHGTGWLSTQKHEVEEKKDYRTDIHKRFEEIAIKFGLKNFDMTGDRYNSRYKDRNVHRAFQVYRIGKEDGRLMSGSNFIIGKVVHSDGERIIKFSNKPVVHTSRKLAKAEMRRLAVEQTGQVFVLYGSVTSAIDRGDSRGVKPAAPHLDEEVLDVRRPRHHVTVDNFGNQIKLTFPKRIEIFEYIYFNDTFYD